MLHTVTAIEAQRFDKLRVNVHLDGRFALSISSAVAVERGLQPGVKLSDREVEDLRSADLEQRCYDAALAFLAYRPRSEQEVRLRLQRRGYDDTLIGGTIGRLRQAGLIDDAAFAAFWRENRERFNPRGGRLIKAELRQKGVDTETIVEATSGIDEAEGAYRIAAKRARQLAGAERRDFFRKIQSLLLRRGFGYDVAQATCERLWRELLENPEA